MTLSLLMPVFNEAQTIAAVVERVQAAPIDQGIVLVDDVSSDGPRRLWILSHRPECEYCIIQ